jgi:hypothetical protein
MRLGTSVVSADRFFGKAMRRRYPRHRALADQLGEAMPDSIPHKSLILGITDDPFGQVEMDLDDEIGIIDVGRDASVSYAPKDKPDMGALDRLFADCCDRAIDAYPHFDAATRSRLHEIVAAWRAAC